ncbi:MAG: guanylate kinase, partial [Clostridiales bacterium]|nr:guanylate kinase [Clostridiales bacterium]
MKMNKKGQLIILSGPSGSGKGTVLSELLQSDDN